MKSALWHHTGAIWPLGVSCSLTWYDMGAIAHIVQMGGIRTVLEIGVEHGGLAAWLMAFGTYTGCVYRGIDITLAPLHTRALGDTGAIILERDAWSDATVREMGQWLDTQPAPALIICDGGDKAKELHLYAPLLRPGDVMIGHDYHNEYGDDALTTMPATVRQERADWLDDTLLCMWVKA